MNLTPVRIVQPWRAPAWAPARMAQAAPAPSAPVQVSLWSLDGPIWAVATDIVVVTTAVMLSQGYGHYHSRWSSVFWGVAAIAGFKTALDLSRIYR